VKTLVEEVKMLISPQDGETEMFGSGIGVGSRFFTR
jgi:hypothetical protein